MISSVNQTQAIVPPTPQGDIRMFTQSITTDSAAALAGPPPQPVRLRELPRLEQPRGRICEHGPAALSDAELLAIVLGSGIGELNAVQLAQRMLVDYGSWIGLQRVSAGELIQLHGIGEAKAARIIASMEIGRRLVLAQPEQRPQIESPADVAKLLMVEMCALEQEQLRVILLNTKNYVLKIETVYIGTINSAAVRVCEVFKAAIRHNAAAIIVAHNHPSSDPAASPEDLVVTRQLREAGELLGIEVLDHVIIGQGRWISLRERRVGFER
jgi:DNA repair protein RadC